MLKDKSRKRNPRQNVLEDEPIREDVKHFRQEAEWLGRKAGKRGSEYREWYYDTFGVIGTILSAVFSLAFLGIGIFMLDFFARETASIALAGIREFLLANVDVFFIIFLLSSFIKYCSRRRRGVRLAISPLSGALGATVFFWTAVNVALIANAGNIMIYAIANSIRNNLAAIFVIFSILGYIVVLSNVFLKEFRDICAEKQLYRRNRSIRYTAQNRINYPSLHLSLFGNLCAPNLLGLAPL